MLTNLNHPFCPAQIDKKSREKIRRERRCKIVKMCDSQRVENGGKRLILNKDKAKNLVQNFEGFSFCTTKKR